MSTYSDLSPWNSGLKGNDYHFFDQTISEYFFIGGTACYIHMYLGVKSDSANTDNNITVDTGSDVTSIQDVLWLENRDRKYKKTVHELRGIYNVQDHEFNLLAQGLFLTNDTIFLEFHLNDMIKMLGRKLMSGDVIEMPHLRDDVLLDGGPAINKFYVVKDALRASDGYSATWFPHIWRVKMEPMTDSQEYSDILDQEAEDAFGNLTGSTLGDLMSTVGTELGINEAIVEQAIKDVKHRNFETQQFYIVPGDEYSTQYPWIFAGDGIPPNGSEPVANGTQYPDSPTIGEYFLRTDYNPPILWQWHDGFWGVVEIDYRYGEWTMAHRVLKSFVNNNAMTEYNDGTINPEKQALNKAVTLKPDL